jgi:hypothetical protein
LNLAERLDAKKAKERALASLLRQQQNVSCVDDNESPEVATGNKERLLEVYNETVRQRNSGKSVLASIMAFNGVANNSQKQQAKSVVIGPKISSQMADAVGSEVIMPRKAQSEVG